MGFLTKAVRTLATNMGLLDPRLYNWVGGGSTSSGEPMSVELAMQQDVVWACVRRIAETIATLPLHLYESVDDHAKKVTDHPLYTVLHSRPNIEMTAVNFWESMVACYLLWGNSFALKEYGVRNRIVALIPLRPDRMIVKRLESGALEYTYQVNGRTYKYTEEDVLHIRGFSLDGMWGLSPIAQARQQLATVASAQKSQAAFYRNGMRPSGFLVSPKEAGYLTEPQRELARGLVENFKGASQTGSVPLLEAGWDFKDVAMPNKDAEFLATMQFSVEQICRWFDVPPILIGHSGQTTWGSGIEQLVLGWLTLSLRSHLKRIEQAVNMSLLTAAEQSRYYAEYNSDALLRTDATARAQQMASLAQNGLRTRNELRALDNMPPLAEGGDIATVQANLMPIDKVGSPEHLGSNVSKTIPSEQAKEPSTTGANIPG